MFLSLRKQKGINKERKLNFCMSNGTAYIGKRSYSYRDVSDNYKNTTKSMRVLYKDEYGKLLFRQSFCGYIDILGFSEKIVNNDLEFFSKYLRTLDFELNHIDKTHNLSGDGEFKSFELKIFTDNFVFGHPWDNQYGEKELGNIFEVLSHIQLTFIKADIFFRGAVSVSKLYMDENIVLGPALIESYKLESEKAIYPRIILSKEVVEIVKKHINYYGDQHFSPQSSEYLIDVDGYCFINYLISLFYNIDEADENQIINELNQHKEPIIKNLNLHKDNFKLFDKFSWTANYHNYFCDNFVLPHFPKIDTDKIKIDNNLFSRTIKRII